MLSESVQKVRALIIGIRDGTLPGDIPMDYDRVMDMVRNNISNCGIRLSFLDPDAFAVVLFSSWFKLWVLPHFYVFVSYLLM